MTRLSDFKDTLPDTLHELLALSIKDMREFVTLPGHIIDMGYWYAVEPTEIGNQCYACAAGVTVYKGLPEDIDDLLPGQLPGRVSNKMSALNYLRTGEIALAWLNLHNRNNDEFPEEVHLHFPVPVFTYSGPDVEEDGESCNECTFEEFLDHMTRLQQYLAEKGI